MEFRYLTLLLAVLAASHPHLSAAEGGYPHHATPTPSVWYVEPYAPPKLKLPRPECPDIDFAELVLAECAPPPPPPTVKKFVHHHGYVHKHEKVGAGHGGAYYHKHVSPAHVHVKVYPTPPAPLVRDAAFEECEKEVTARELFNAITKTKDQNCAAQILIQTASVGGIEGGFRIPVDFNFVPNCDKREDDPDVIAVKAAALGILTASGSDPTLVDKIANGIVPSFTPEGEEPKPPTPATKTCVKVPITVGNVTTLEQKCTVTKEKTHFVDRDQFFAKLNNMTLMTEVFFQDANLARPCSDLEKYLPQLTQPQPQPPSVLTGRRLFSDFIHGRNLQCASCDNADSLPCSYCWQKDLCGDLYWCT